PRKLAGIVPGRTGGAAARRADRHPIPFRDAAVAKGARNAPPRAAHDDPADDRAGAAPHAPDAGADGADAGGRRRAGAAVIRIVATGMAALAAVGVFGQSNTPAVAHEYADVNGVRLHYAH